MDNIDSWLERIQELELENKKLRDALEHIKYEYEDYQEFGHKDAAPRAISEMGNTAIEALI